MAEKVDADFSGYATKAGLRCSDGRTITAEAFKHMDGMTVPLVWHHGHDDPENVLGHAILEAREDGMYCRGYFNETSKGQSSKILVEHGDIKNLSIWANALKETVVKGGRNVIHGMIREVSLVLSGANPGAVIDQVRIAHSDDDVETLDDEAIIFTDAEFEHSGVAKDEPEVTVDETEKKDESATEDENLEHAEDEKTVEDVLKTMDDEQKNVVDYLIDSAFEEGAKSVQHSEDGSNDKNNPEGDLTHQDKEGTGDMTRNVFEAKDKDKGATEAPYVLSHSDMQSIMADFKDGKVTLKHAFENFIASKDELKHSITDIDVLFPDAKLVTGVELISRRMEWVQGVLGGVKATPMSRIKSMAADLTADEARAKGYVKGNLKKEEIIRLLKRVTTPTTIYKKQALDRDDVVDIVDIDIIVWIKGEMRVMLEEEIARGILIGDGREPDDEDKIDEEHLRPIAFDDEMYAHPITVPANTTPNGYVETIIRSRKFYKGSGSPTLFTTEDVLTDMLLIKNKIDDRVYKTEDDLRAALRVSKIVTVEVMEDVPDVICILVNLSDYSLGADKGGAVSLFDDFDIDYNKLKYLIETRVSGALTKPKSAVVVKRTTGTPVVATTPSFNAETNTITIPTVMGVAYYDVTDITGPGVLMTAGTHVITETTSVEGRAASGYSFAHNTDNDWTFPYTP